MSIAPLPADSPSQVQNSPESPLSNRAFLLLLGLWAILAILALCRGPALGDHEVIVAQIARQSLQSGSWLVPRYLDTPFLMKPPLAPWLVGAVSAVFPSGSALRNVNDFTARLPSLVATFVTILLLWRLGNSMFGQRKGWITAFVYMTCICALLYAFNATAEAVLTLFCTWSFAEFWWSRTAHGRSRTIHQIRFYVALSLAMLAKGPMPFAVVCMPIAVYWWLDRTTRRAIVRGQRHGFETLKGFVRDLWPRFVLALRDLGLWWGVPLFLAIVLPWFFLVARREPYLWTLWNYEYLDRLQGKYPGVKGGDYYYYIPIALGLAIPWALSVPEALIAPFRRVYRPFIRPLVFAWYWSIVSLVICSLMSFKKSYYIVPAMPGIALLLTPVLYQFFFVRLSTPNSDPKRRSQIIAGLMIFIGVAAAVGGSMAARRMFPEEWRGNVVWGAPLVLLLAFAGYAFGAMNYVLGARLRSIVSVGTSTLIAFVLCWCWLGPALGNVEAPLELVRRLDESGISRSTPLYWASNRPDGRVMFYAGRSMVQVMDPYRLIAEHHGSKSGEDLREMVGSEICTMLRGPKPVYFLFQREDYDLLMSWFKPPARELFWMDRGHKGIDKDDWIVATNEGVTPSARG